MKELKLTYATLLFKNYNSNLEVFWLEDESNISHFYEGDIDSPVDENIESFIDYELGLLHVVLTEADKEKLYDELRVFFYPHSKECFE